MFNYTKFPLPNAFQKKYMNVQRCIVSTIMYINILQLFRQTNPKMPKYDFDKIRQNEKLCLCICLIRRILCIFNQLEKRNEPFIIRLINTGGTSGQHLARLRQYKKFTRDYKHSSYLK